ncbi:MAG: STAS domain-containing protein [Candidatus Didemnitutus sp.]|jgi:anti-anti-sigma factor|nr:STAS domain-containing protein [Candidatus Didemnitutus sp.]MCM2274931.1 STAS domain-containing protein [Candidatus Didemnitutus sp.]
MPEIPKPAFLVNAYTDPVLVRVQGRASFTNSGSLKDFFTEMIRQGKTRFVLDFQQCASMDSTFLGVLAGAALQVRRLTPPGTLTLVRVGDRNLELIRNLGLHRLATVDAGDFELSFDGGGAQVLSEEKKSEIESAKLVLEAHENLVSADSANAAKFQDVLAFLRNRVDGR